MTPAPPLGHPAAGPIACVLAADHRRLEVVLERATAVPGRIDPALYAEFRAPVRVAPHHDSARVERHIEEALASAGDGE